MRPRTKLAVAIVGAVIIGVGALVYLARLGVEDSCGVTHVDTWDTLSLSNFVFHEIEGEWWGVSVRRSPSGATPVAG